MLKNIIVSLLLIISVSSTFSAKLDIEDVIPQLLTALENIKQDAETANNAISHFVGPDWKSTVKSINREYKKLANALIDASYQIRNILKALKSSSNEYNAYGGSGIYIPNHLLMAVENDLSQLSYLISKIISVNIVDTVQQAIPSFTLTQWGYIRVPKRTALKLLTVKNHIASIFYQLRNTGFNLKNNLKAVAQSLNGIKQGSVITRRLIRALVPTIIDISRDFGQLGREIKAIANNYNNINYMTKVGPTGRTIYVIRVHQLITILNDGMQTLGNTLQNIAQSLDQLPARVLVGSQLTSAQTSNQYGGVSFVKKIGKAH